MMAELDGKSAGYNKGKGGSMQIASPEIGIQGANGIVAGGIPLAVGAGLSSKFKKDGRVTVGFFGDGATNQGSFHEALNLASDLNVPVVFVCENNQFGVGTCICNATRLPDLAKRSVSYCMPVRFGVITTSGPAWSSASKS
jgi:TPP-dependent pyruvate/acetoin dehydrogenase alpha subunit